MQCNIDSRGKAVRLVSGLVTLAVAGVLAALKLAGVIEPDWVWFAVGGAAAGGALQVFEGWSGWCVLRAMGVKTPV